MDPIKLVTRKYRDLIPRSFKTKLDIFLFDRCIEGKSLRSIEPWEFKSFGISEKIVTSYERAWQLGPEESLNEGGLKMAEVDKQIETWLKENKELKAKLLKEYKAYFITDYFPFSKFEKIYSQNPEERVCHYCKLSDEDNKKLRDLSQINTKRGRGFSMEIDRIKPNYEYTADNIVLACYWCNNAKTDEFSESEFLDHIGPGIGKVWNERTNKT